MEALIVDAVIVDAMNVIGARPDGWWRDRAAAVRRLAGELAPLAAEGTAVTMVVDGDPQPDLPEGEHRGVMVLYAGRGPGAADDRIVADLAEITGAASPPSGRQPRRFPAPGGSARDAQVVVVTADRNLRERVGAQGITSVGPSTLRRQLAALARRGHAAKTDNPEQGAVVDGTPVE